MRDRARHRLTKIVYGMMALGWRGAARHWQRYRMAYLMLAGLATPLVLSVHSVVSLDFTIAILPGWHSIIFSYPFILQAGKAGTRSQRSHPDRTVPRRECEGERRRDPRCRKGNVFQDILLDAPIGGTEGNLHYSDSLHLHADAVGEKIAHCESRELLENKFAEFEKTLSERDIVILESKLSEHEQTTDAILAVRGHQEERHGEGEVLHQLTESDPSLPLRVHSFAARRRLPKFRRSSSARQSRWAIISASSSRSKRL